MDTKSTLLEILNLKHSQNPEDEGLAEFISEIECDAYDESDLQAFIGDEYSK